MRVFNERNIVDALADKWNLGRLIGDLDIRRFHGRVK
jgi:hypothetical protein